MHYGVHNQLSRCEIQGWGVNADFITEVEPQSSASSVLRTLALCDLVDSTGLVERMGDLAAAELIRKHDRLARTLADRHHGREIDKTDGFMMMFDRPIQAVAFALDYQRGLKQFNAAEGANLSARVGIHVGDVVVWDNSAEDIARGAKPIEVEGLVKPVTSRLMNLALPGQILLSNIAYSLAHRAQGELGEYLETARWRTHGRYRFRGVPDPVAVFEVGEDGLAPLKAPPWSSKAHREVPFWRRPSIVVTETLVIAALIVIPLIMFLRPDPAIAFASRDWVVVGSLHNLTDESAFDDALESALRIGLEQSRHVNVLSDLKVRDTITRMQRDPDKTEVDRAVGSEVAIRDGARALILPTIAEIGGRVRITAEVIDPHTQTTVYSESVDGIGKESILPSLDKINERLRLRLGEALATVSNESKPLEKVATKNLEALRFFSLAVRASTEGDTDQSIVLLENAITIDAEFGRARINLAVARLVQGDQGEAEKQLLEALRVPARLTTRSRLTAEALMAGLHSPKETLLKARALAASYPDFFLAQGIVAYYAWNYANDFSEAIDATRRNISAKNPNRGTGLYLLGTLMVGSEKYSAALDLFKQASAEGTKYQNNSYASAYAVNRKHGQADEILAQGRASTGSNEKLGSIIYSRAFSIDRGNWGELESLSPLRAKNGLGLNSSDREILKDADSALFLAFASEDERKMLIGDLEKANANAKIDGDGLQLGESGTSLLFRRWLVAHYSEKKIDTSIFTRENLDSQITRFPALQKISGLIAARSKLLNGEIDGSLNDLLASVDGTELYVTHLELMNILESKGDFAAARDQARWLIAHRGRAYTEVIGGMRFIPVNVAVSDLAQLHDAELSVQLGELDAARSSLSRFKLIWTKAGMPDGLVKRILTLERKIEAGST